MWWLLCTPVQPQDKILEKTFALVETCHVRGDEEQWINRQILHGALRALDPHSAYFPPKHYRKIQQMNQGNIRGIGIEVHQCNGRFVVQHVINDTPAMYTGIKIGDTLTHVDGIELTPLTPPDVVMSKIHGKPGTEVIIGINNKHMKIMRAPINTPSVRCFFKNSTLYLRISFFSDKTAKEVWSTIECYRNKLKRINIRKNCCCSPDPQQNANKTAIKHIVLDLRSNPGGSLDAAVETVGLFVDNAIVVHVDSRLPDYDKTHLCQGKALYPSIPLTVWIDENTASAAEVVTAALEDHKRATIIGGPSFGKGCIQDFFELPHGYGGIKLTVGYCYSPKGRPIHRDYSR